MNVYVWNADCLAALKQLDDESIDAVVTDPPYELNFMSRKWDGTQIAYNIDLWQECLRVLKPGGHLLSFGGTRTYHRMACAIEDAGFELRDSLLWVYGSGFPKSQNVSKAIDKAAGAKREVVGKSQSNALALKPGQSTYVGEYLKERAGSSGERPVADITTPATEGAKQWEGWGTALKPAWENVTVARKPLSGTVASNVQQHGTGALNIDGCRVGLSNGEIPSGSGDMRDRTTYAQDVWTRTQMANGGNTTPPSGRWPPNLVLVHSESCTETECAEDCPVGELDRQSGDNVYGAHRKGPVCLGFGDSGGASRFFPCFKYQAKAPPKERPKVDGISHSTVKPLTLMRWLVRLVTPPGGIVLDPFVGSGTTLEAAYLEGFLSIGIENYADYIKLIEARFEKHPDATLKMINDNDTD